jgi:predicted enzyme related to lactoylglutathione lyase
VGKRERYEPGTFSWVDLSASDADGAKVFYGELFGWEFEDNEVSGVAFTQCVTFRATRSQGSSSKTSSLDTGTITSPS